MKFTYSTPKDGNKDFFNVDNSSNKVDDINRKPSNSEDLSFQTFQRSCVCVCLEPHRLLHDCKPRSINKRSPDGSLNAKRGSAETVNGLVFTGSSESRSICCTCWILLVR